MPSALCHIILSEFSEKIQNIPSLSIEGIYITGSIPLHDFHPNKSDIDFLVICRSLPDETIFRELKKIHSLIAGKYPKPSLNGSYVSIDCLSVERPETFQAITYQDSQLKYGLFGMAPVQLHELSQHALTFSGTPAHSLPLHIKREYLDQFLKNNLNTYWKKWIDQHSTLLSRKLLVLIFPKLTEWSVLGIARQLYTLNTGKIISKQDAGLYCLEILPEELHPIVREAIAIRQDKRSYPFIGSYLIRPSFRRMKQTLKCLNGMLDIQRKQ